MTPQILHVFSSFAVGGVQVRFARLAAHFGAAYRHAIVAMDGNYACESRLDPALEIVYPAVTFTKGSTVANIRALRGYLRSSRPDLMVTSNWGTIEWAAANLPRVVPHIHIEDGFGPEEQNRQLRRRVWMRRMFLRRATVVVPSLTLRGIATRTWRLPAGRVKYIPNGVDCAGFTPRPRIESEPLIIGTVAALRPEKNLPRLLWAFRRVALQQTARLVIVGDGPERAKLELLAADLGLADVVEFAGHTGSPEAHYRTFDIFALSSDTEQMPLSVIEAMAAGLPVAATDVGDIAEMVGAENRRFVTGLQHNALAAALQMLAADPALRHRIGAENREKALKLYSQDDMFWAYARLFDSAMAPRMARAETALPSAVVGNV